MADEKPATPLSLPSDHRKLIQMALDIISQCRSSAGIRAAYCRQLNAICDTGRQDGTRSLINMIFSHIDRLASHLYSPTELNFTIDCEYEYPENILDRCEKAAKILTREFERSNTDIAFGQGVFESLKYGAAILKQWVQQEGPEHLPVYQRSLVMPWQFGVYREDVNELSRQPALCETVMLTMPEVWRRIYHLPEAEKLYNRIKQHAQKGQAGDEYNSFFHQILSTAPLNTGSTSLTRPIPGGIVQLNNDPNYAIVGPETAVEMVKMHELWVWGEKDYQTVQIIEPDILLTRYKRGNLLVSGEEHSGLHPYSLIQPNIAHGYFWGRSEIVDLIEPQGFLSATADDIKRLFGLQVDKILGFSGFDGITAEKYDQMRGAGFLDGPPGSSISDLTPKFPPEALTLLDKIIQLMNMIGGFDNILGGQAQPGVRANEHAETLMKAASPRLRDRALVLERQLASAADLRLSLMEIKDPRNYWTDGHNEESIQKTSFLLHDLPEDRRVSVDGHSSSPIFMNSHQNLVAFGVKAGFIDGESAIDLLQDLPMKEILKNRLRLREEKQEKLMQELLAKDPNALEKIMAKRGH